jgi:hypothetical protein
MGGTVGKVVKQVAKPVTKALGLDRGSSPAPAAAATTPAPAAKAVRDEVQETLAARRRARRGGRALLSEARLNPEGGVDTLGSSGGMQ